MTTFVTADLHLASKARDAYRHDAMKRIIAKVRELKCNRVLILGDLTEEKDHHSSELVNAIVRYIDELADICPVYILQGNHDFNKNPGQPFFGFLNYIPYVRWIGKPTLIGARLFLPYTKDWEKDWSGLDMVKPEYIFAHNTFMGATGGFGCELEGIPLEAFGKRKGPVIAGDVHVPQKLGIVQYVGAPYLVDFGDDYEPRAILIEPDRSPWYSLSLAGPQKRLVEIHYQNLSDMSCISNVNAGDIVKVRISVTHEQGPRWAEMKEQVRKWGEEQGCTVHAIVPEMLNDGGKRQERQKRDMKPDAEIVKEYGTNRQVDHKTIEKGLEML